MIKLVSFVNVSILMMFSTTVVSAQYNGASPLGCASAGGNTPALSYSMGNTFAKSSQANGILLSPGLQQSYTKLVFRGRCISPQNKPIPFVTLNLSGGITDSLKTGQNSNYYFPLSYRGKYSITPTKTNDIAKKNGVSVADALLVQGHILNKFTLATPYKLIAADVDNSGSVTVLDILYLKRMILGIDSLFPNKKLWAFVDSSYQFPNPSNPFPYPSSKQTSGLLISKDNQTFYGIKLGDVNDDWNAAVFSAPSFAQPIELMATNYEPTADGIIRVPIKASSIKNILGLQFTLGFDATKYQLTGIENKAIAIDWGLTKKQDGLVSGLWIDPNNVPLTLANETIAFNLLLQPINHENSQPQLVLNSSVTPIEAYDYNYGMHNIVLKNQAATMDTQAEMTVKLSPNPAKDNATLQFTANESKTVEFAIIDAVGKIVYKQKCAVVAGTNKVNLHFNSAQYPTGLYHVVIKGLDKEIATPLIISSTVK